MAVARMDFAGSAHFRAPAVFMQLVSEAAISNTMSVSDYIRQALRDRLERDGYDPANGGKGFPAAQ